MDAVLTRAPLSGVSSADTPSVPMAPETAHWLAKREARAQLPSKRRRPLRITIFERDGWICQLCLGPVKRRTPAGHPHAPTLDHRVPQADGGSNDPENLQLAHAVCNNVRGDLPLSEVDPEVYARVAAAALRWITAAERFRTAATRRERARRSFERWIRRARNGESLRSPAGRRGGSGPVDDPFPRWLGLSLPGASDPLLN